MKKSRKDEKMTTIIITHFQDSFIELFILKITFLFQRKRERILKIQYF